MTTIMTFLNLMQDLGCALDLHCLMGSSTPSHPSQPSDCVNLILFSFMSHVQKDSFVIFFLSKNYKITIIFSSCIQNTLPENIFKF